MLSFNVDFNIMNDIISFFSNYYFFEKATIDFLYNILKNNKKQDISKIEFDDSNNETFQTNEIKNDTKTIIIEENNYSQLIQKKQPLDNISKAKQRAIKIEKEQKQIIKKEDVIKEEEIYKTSKEEKIFYFIKVNYL